jgi:hypothetical protein
MTDTTLAERLARCVRKLEWGELVKYLPDNHETGGFHIEARSGFGVYRIDQFIGNPDLLLECGSRAISIPDRTSVETAKAAAQADYTARILAALDMDALAQEVEAMVGWRDIATAPKDGTEILVWAQWDWEGMAGDRTDSDFAWRVAVWDEPPSKPSAFWSVSENPYSDLAVRATLWRPLPPPPSAPAKEGSRDER